VSCINIHKDKERLDRKTKKRKKERKKRKREGGRLCENEKGLKRK